MTIRLQHIVLGFALLTLTAGTQHGGEDDAAHLARFNEDYSIYSLPVPSDLTLGGETVPVDDPDVAERLDREILVNTYWQSNSILLIKRSSRWLPRMKEIFREEGVPEDLTYIGLIESGFQNVVSPAGATGYWQFMESTAKEYNLVVNGEVDERYHELKATRAAARYLKDAKEKLGSWTLAAASYNMGMNGVERQLERQKANSYYDLLLNSETSRYVFRILAIKEIVENRENYGFHVRDEDLYSPIETYQVEVNGAVEDFAQFAQDLGINYKTLKYHNPWLREAYLKNRENRTYVLDIPVDKSFISEE